MKPLLDDGVSCERLASSYELLEHLSFGNSLEQQRFAFLEQTKAAKRALECGGGDGRFLARLLAVNADVHVDFVDLSPRMVAIAERRVERMGGTFRRRVRFWTGDVRRFEGRPEGYDLIATHFFLDWFTEEQLMGIVTRLASWRAANVRWLVSDFCEAEQRFCRLWTHTVIRTLYAGFRVATGLQVNRMPNYMAALSKQRFTPRFQKSALGGLLHSSVWVV
jgi:cyclopropane fatty-acyl-phospholipid synthase-like methyltransferase